MKRAVVPPLMAADATFSAGWAVSVSTVGKRAQRTNRTVMRRAQLKFDARRHLSGKYGDALGVAVVTSLIAGALSLALTLGNRWFMPDLKLPFVNGLDGLGGKGPALGDLFQWMDDYLARIRQAWPLIALGILITLSATALYRIFVGNVISVGRERWYLRAAHNDVAPPFSIMFTLFRRGQYGKTVGGMFWVSVWLFIWSSIPAAIFILGLLPSQLVYLHAFLNRTTPTQGLVLRLAKQYGLPLFFFSLPMIAVSLLLAMVMTVVLIRKRYSYRLVPYLLADNPSLGGRRALSLSKAMTRGSLWRLFLLDLSFMGWILLCLMCICFPWVTLHLFAPYYFMTWAEAYKMLRDQASMRGLVRMEELGYVRVS